MKIKLDIVFDFDGVVCDHVINNWSHEKFVEPIQKGIELIKELHRNGHNLKLSTARLYPTMNGKHDHDVYTGKAKVILKKKLTELGIIHYFSEITGYKCYGDVYIDDRAVNFKQNTKEELHELINIAQHNRSLKLNSF